MIQLEHVSVRYGADGAAGAPALDDVSMAVEAGEHVAVAGPLGAGASTLLRLLNGVVPHLVPAAVQGRLEVAGRDPLSLPVHAMAGTVGLVLDDPGTATTQGTVAEEIAFGLESLGVAPGDMRGRVAGALREVELAGMEERDPATLSGGEQQRLAIASVLAMAPPVLVLDEPATNLDPAGAAAILAILARLRDERGVTVVRADRDAAGPASGATRVVWLDAGRLVREGQPTAADDGPWAPSLADPRPGPGRAPGATVLTMRDIVLRYPGAAAPALADISLDVAAGEVLGVCGPNGGGKSTLARLAAGVLQPDAGMVRLAGLDAAAGRRVTPRERAAAAGLVFQDPRHQLLAATVRDELALGLRALRLPEADVAARVTETAERVGLEPLLGAHPLRLARAMRKLVTVAAIRAMRPRLLVLDEPTIGADELLRSVIAREIADAAGEGTAVLVLSHDLRLLAQVTDRLAVVVGGRLTAVGPTASILADGAILTAASLLPAPLTPGAA